MGLKKFFQKIFLPWSGDPPPPTRARAAPVSRPACRGLTTVVPDFDAAARVAREARCQLAESAFFCLTDGFNSVEGLNPQAKAVLTFLDRALAGQPESRALALQILCEEVEKSRGVHRQTVNGRGNLVVTLEPALVPAPAQA